MRTSITTLVGIALIGGLVGCSKSTPPPDETKVTPTQPAAETAQVPDKLDAPTLFLPVLGPEINVPDGMALDKDGNVYLSVPNYADSSHAGKVMKITIGPDGSKSMDLCAMLPKHPESGLVHPMGLEVGPDGNVYIADNQYFWNKDYKSRLLKLIIEDGKAVDCVVAADGFKLANAVRWHGNDVYVSDTFFDVPGKKHQSGILRISVAEMDAGTVHLDLKGKDSVPNAEGSHLIAQFTARDFGGDGETAGADGVCFDSAGNLYTGNFGDGVISKVTFDADRKVVKQEIIVDDPSLPCCDGIVCDTTKDWIYITDSKQNAIHILDAKDNSIRKVWENDDNDGSAGLLDQPCEPLLRGNELIIVNLDYCQPEWGLKNQGPDDVNTISVFELK